MINCEHIMHLKIRESSPKDREKNVWGASKSGGGSLQLRIKTLNNNLHKLFINGYKKKSSQTTINTYLFAPPLLDAHKSIWYKAASKILSI